MSARLALLCVVAVSLHPADANAFLGRLPDMAAGAQRVDPALEKALLSEIEEVLGSEHRHATEGRLQRVEVMVRPTYAALPKNGHGRLDHAAVRYAMHRLFVQRHAWFVRGLEPGSSSWNTSSPTVILKDRLPEYVQGLFEKRVGGRGFDLHELAIFAATLENLVHHETMQRLRDTYRALERSTEDPLSQEEANDVVDAYMMNYILGTNFSSLSPTEMREQHRAITEVYPTWPTTQAFLRDVQSDTLPHREETTFENVASVVEEVGERYGRWQAHECDDIKRELVLLEDRGTGRVRIADFYGSAVHDGKWQFSESLDYLRQLGALDESDPSNLRVIIPNYIMSPSNCVASSSYYSVCCLDECEDLLGHLEQSLGKPSATPSEILVLVSNLASSTVSNSRALSPGLLQRLDDVARHHGGQVPLHGRLFAQWMHQAYPRECPYPHVTGTTNPQRAEDYMKETGQDVTASEDEMRQHAGNTGPNRRGENGSGEVADGEDFGMWTMEEELVTASIGGRLAGYDVKGPRARGAVRGAFFVVAVVSTTLALFQTFGGVLAGLPSQAPEKQQAKYCV